MTAPAMVTAGASSTKAQALRSYDPRDFPELTGREEEWRFTPLRPLLGLLDGATADRPAPGPDRGEAVLPAGASLATVPRDDPRLGSVLTPFDKLSAAAYHRFERATVISVAAGARLAGPVLAPVTGVRDGGSGYGHTFIEVGALAEATIVVEHTGAGTLADNVEVSVGDGAQLTLVTVADWAPAAVHAQHLRIRVGRDAKVAHVQVAVGGALVRQFTSVEYAGPGGDCEAYGLYFAGAGQHLEHRLLVDHAVPDCRSYVTYRGALHGEGAHGVWIGDVLIRATATGTDTYEINRNLVLSDGARADSVPNLEIETGEVVGAGHASTTGRFDDEQLFYLMSRGIPAGEARRLVVRGFFAELPAKVPVAELRERLGATIEARLAEGGQ